MKSIIFLFLVVVTTAGFTQNCNMYIPLQENKGLEYQSFDSNHKLEGTQKLLITNVVQQAGHTDATILMSSYDSSGELIHKGSYTIQCKGNELVIDIKSLFDESMFEELTGMDISITSVNNITIPNQLSIGDRLPDAEMQVKVSMGGMVMTEINFISTNRKVAARESITTPAGTFESFKITYDNKVETSTMGMVNTSQTKSVEYYAPNVGNIKTRYYDESGKLQSYSLLSKIL